MNTNATHNLLNIVVAIIAILSLPEVHEFIPPEYSIPLMGILAAIKVIINIRRDGVTGLVKEQPPVK